MARDALAARLLETFLGELEEQVRTLNADLLALEATPDDAEHLRSLFRVAHTLKGAARAADVPLIERACHALETLLAAVRDGKTVLEPARFPLLFAAADALEEARRRLGGGGDLTGCALEGVARALQAAEAQAVRPEAGTLPALAVVPTLRAGDGQVRVEAEALDRLLASAGELLVAGGRSTGGAPTRRVWRSRPGASRPGGVTRHAMRASHWSAPRKPPLRAGRCRTLPRSRGGWLATWSCWRAHWPATRGL